MRSRLAYLKLRSENPSTAPEVIAGLAHETTTITREKLASYKLSYEEAGAITRLVLADEVLTDEARYLCVSLVNAAAAGGPDGDRGKLFTFQSMPNPENYLSAKARACLEDPCQQLTTKLYLLDSHMCALKLLRPAEKVFSGTSRSASGRSKYSMTSAVR